MNPLHLTGFGVEVQASNAKPHAELMITDGHRDNNVSERYLFLPRQIEYDSIILENCTGHVSLGALRWLSKHTIPIFFLDFDGSTISSILPPRPVKADLRIAQIQASTDPKKKLEIAHAFVKAKIARSLEVLTWLSGRYDVEREIRMAKHEATKLSKASTVVELRSVEAHVATKYWEGYRKAMPERLRFQGRTTTSHNNNATDPVNAALNYSYGFQKCECRMAVNSVGLEPAVGFLHETSYSQTAESLVFDVMEPFRFLSDLTVIKAFETGWLNPEDFYFTKDDYLYRIETEGKRRLLHLLRERFNSGVHYKGRLLKWDTVIEQKTSELARFFINQYPPLSFQEPAPILERTDNSEIREKILSLTQSEAEKRGIGKSTLHYLRQNARDQRPFRIYSKVREKMATGT